MKKLCLVASVFVLVSYQALAAGCEDYPFGQGMETDHTDQGDKIISTAEVAVAMDDSQSISDARKEATLEAKAQIAHFLGETIQSDKSLDNAVKETIKIAGDSKSVSRDSIKTMLTKIRNSSQQLLRGVIPLGECYTKGQFLRVSVGLKPETIAAALNSASSMTGSQASSPPSNKPAEGGLTGQQGYSNTQTLKKF